MRPWPGTGDGEAARDPAGHRHRFTYGGIATDAGAHVVDSKGNALPGLYAAGECTGIYHHKYPGVSSATCPPASRDRSSAAPQRARADPAPSIGTMLTGAWTFDHIANAFDTTLAEELEPVGFGGQRLQPRPH